MFEIDNRSIAQDGDKYELERLIKENQRSYLEHCKKDFKGRGFELEDLYQVGCVGFYKSIKRFDTRLK